MMNYNNKTIFLLYYFLIIVFLISTNTYFSYDESLIFGGADVRSYISISNSFPSISDQKMMPIHAERFFFYYVFGFFSKILTIEVYNLYRILVFLIIGFINFFLILILKKKKIEINLILIFLTLINLNPYISRYYIAVPTILNDLIFILGITLLIYALVNNKNTFFYLSLIILFFSRQTSVAIIISLMATKLIYTNNFKINIQSIVIAIATFLIIYMINFYYSSHLFDLKGYRWQQYSIETRLFGFFDENINLKQKIIFLLLPLLSYLPLILFFFIFFNFKNLKKIICNNPNIFFYLLFSILIILQPILSGVNITGKNIIRLTTLAYIPILIILLEIIQKNYSIKKIPMIMIYFFITIWSLHPTFSNIKIYTFFATTINNNFK